MAKTKDQITTELQAALDQHAAEPNRGTTWMRIRRSLGVILRENFGYDYFVKVQASRADREAGRVQVRALFGSDVVDLTLQSA